METSILDQASPIMTSNHSIHSGMSSPYINGDEKKLLNHTQTYKEYKEALRQQRANEGSSVYRPREQIITPTNDTQLSETDVGNTKDMITTIKPIYDETNETKKPIQKVMPSRINYQNSSIINGSNDCTTKNGVYLEQAYKKPNSPVQFASGIFSTNSSPGHMPRLVKQAVNYAEGNNKSPNQNGSPKSVTWNSNNPDKYSFTMRREFERAKEEADLIEQLRNVCI